jgi:hypothetical protein
MTCLRLVRLGGKTVCVAMTAWLTLHSVVWAQAPVVAQSSGGGSYVASYALVLLGIGLGLLLVCRSSRRRDRARPEIYDESKAVVKD